MKTHKRRESWLSHVKNLFSPISSERSDESSRGSPSTLIQAVYTINGNRDQQQS